MNFKHIIYLFITISISSCNNETVKVNSQNTKPKTIPNIEFTCVRFYPHDTSSFTEGFLFDNNNLYESTGAPNELLQTKSLFGVVDLTTGKIDTKVEIDKSKYFGEGITFLNDKVYQLTYKSKIGFVYDAKTFKKIKEFTFPSNEGWGMTTDGTNLIMSDGTSELSYLNPNTLQLIKKISVTENGYAKDNINELEYIKGYIFANIWKTNTIVKINPIDGKIVGKLDLSSLANDAKNAYIGSLEMNGIAYDSTENRILITGKLWPKIYELQIGKL